MTEEQLAVAARYRDFHAEAFGHARPQVIGDATPIDVDRRCRSRVTHARCTTVATRPTDCAEKVGPLLINYFVSKLSLLA
jgi:hypothetical protein